MSNCISFDSGSIKFSPDEFDVETFVRHMREPAITERHPEGGMFGAPPTIGENFNSRVYHGWWFLHNAWRFEDGDGKIRIDFGTGRSSHTWRDFKGTLEVLRTYVKKPKVKVFTMRDESDGFKHWFMAKIDFQNAKVSDYTPGL